MDENALKKELFDFNFWDKKPSNLGRIRTIYLKQIKDLLHNKLIKILVGQRRVGKSFLLKQLIEFLIAEQEVDPKNILYINFEYEKFAFIKDKKDLSQVVDFYLKEIKPKSSGKTYLLFDEIQEIEAWEKLINSYALDHNYDLEVFVTGSNSKLLSSEFSTYITGRYIEIDVYPLCFQEYQNFCNVENDKKNLIEFINSSALPGIYDLKPEQELRIKFLSSVKNSILFNDIVKRYKVQDANLLERIFLFLVDNIANPYSFNSINKALNTSGIKTNTMTVSNYVKYLEDAFLFKGIERFDLKGKHILEGEKKYYLNDIGFKNYLSSSYDQALTKKLENHIFNELLVQGYKVYVANIDTKEVDFVAEKKDRKIYIQVAMTLNSEKVINREYGNLELIKDHWEKFVVSLDDLKFNPKEGIRHVQAWDFWKMI